MYLYHWFCLDSGHVFIHDTVLEIKLIIPWVETRLFDRSSRAQAQFWAEALMGLGLLGGICIANTSFQKILHYMISLLNGDIQHLSLEQWFARSLRPEVFDDLGFANCNRTDAFTLWHFEKLQDDCPPSEPGNYDHFRSLKRPWISTLVMDSLGRPISPGSLLSRVSLANGDQRYCGGESTYSLLNCDDVTRWPLDSHDYIKNEGSNGPSLLEENQRLKGEVKRMEDEMRRRDEEVRRKDKAMRNVEQELETIREETEDGGWWAQEKRWILDEGHWGRKRIYWIGRKKSSRRETDGCCPRRIG